MKLLGLDYGKSKVGLAYADGYLAEPLKIVKYEEIFKKVKTICRQLGIEKIIIGLSEERTARETLEFTEKLKKEVNLPIEFQDETLTSKDALDKMRQVGKKLKREDAISAAIILQSYLDLNNV